MNKQDILDEIENIEKILEGNETHKPSAYYEQVLYRKLDELEKELEV